MGTKGDNNRQRIVDAADQLFYTRGYNQTSFRDISDMTGIPRGNFYYYFKTKDDILGAVVDSRLRSIRDYIEHCDAVSTDPAERLLAFTDMLDNNKARLVEFGCPIGSLTTELAKDHQELHQTSAAVFETLRDWLSQQFAQLEFSDAEHRAMDMLARMQGITMMSCAFRDQAYLERSHQELKYWLREQMAASSTSH